MGHIHLAELPTSKRWQHVAGLIGSDAPNRAVIAATVVAAAKDLEHAASDPALAEGVRLLAAVPRAAQSPALGMQLRALGINVQDEPALEELAVGLSLAIGRMRDRPDVRADFAELVRRALLGTLFARLGNDLPGLLAADAEPVRAALKQLDGREAFAVSARTFFARLMADTLALWLDRALSDHTGPERRFATFGQRDAFDRALDSACIDATETTCEFAGAWYASTVQDGTITTSDRAVSFARATFRMLIGDLSPDHV